ncbi:MAG: hypothetical protein H0V92_01955 [Pseudonocardiales bacterium]|nr:hypothetical protein [Pseudonocardiales bacterium]
MTTPLTMTTWDMIGPRRRDARRGTTVLSALAAGQIDSPRTVSKLAMVRRAAARHSSGAEFRDSYDELTRVGSP